jgi:hypothetical protein
MLLWPPTDESHCQALHKYFQFTLASCKQPAELAIRFLSVDFNNDRLRGFHYGVKQCCICGIM